MTGASEMSSISQEAKIARRRARNREAQRRHREATKAKLAELESLRPHVHARHTFLPPSPHLPAYSPDASASDTETSSWRLSCGRCDNDHGGQEYEHRVGLPSPHWRLTDFEYAPYLDQTRTPHRAPSEPPSTGLDFQEFAFALPTDEDSLTLDSHQGRSLGDSSLPPDTSFSSTDTTTSSNHGLLRGSRAESPPQNELHSRSRSSVSVQSFVSNQSALHLAAASGNTECVRALLTHNADVNAIDTQGRTPLHACVAAGNTDDHVAVVQLLVENGASPILKDRTGMGPLQIAAERGNHFVLKALLQIGVDVNAL